MTNQINEILQPFQRFGISLGLDRINNLLKLLGNPEKKVPIIHVAGTNGKGSVCAYLSSILTEAGYKTGRYTSPHLIHWTERICVNDRPITEGDLIATLKEITKTIANYPSGLETPTQFEVITAAMWLYFANSKVDVAVIEVGLGGRLDATNVCDRTLASIIVSISREHWQRLGDTIAKITFEKAGVLKNQCPAIIGELPPEAQEVVKSRVKELNCPTRWITPATKIIREGEKTPNWAKYEDIQYPLALAGDIQLHNSAIAIATVKNLRQQGWNITQEAIESGMKKTRWRGRLEWTNYRGQKILIDGAHNVASAKVLRQYLDSFDRSITFIMGMLSTKDHQGVFTALLSPDDRLHLVPVPDHSTADTQELSTLALQIMPQLALVKTYEDLFMALDGVTNAGVDSPQETIVLCGSLYLLGYFLSKV